MQNALYTSIYDKCTQRQSSDKADASDGLTANSPHILPLLFRFFCLLAQLIIWKLFERHPCVCLLTRLLYITTAGHRDFALLHVEMY